MQISVRDGLGQKEVELITLAVNLVTLVVSVVTLMCKVECLFYSYQVCFTGR